MAVFQSTYSAKVEHIAGATTELDSVQSVTITQGRQNLSDSYRSTVITIEGRDPGDLPNIKVGDTIRVTIEAFDSGSPVTLPSYETEHEGRVANVVIDYGPIAAMDRWTITTEDAIAVLGRGTFTGSVTSGTVTGDAAKQITDSLGITMTIAGSSVPSVSTVKATTFDSANALDAFQIYANTEMAYVVQQGPELLWVPRKGWTYTGSICTFSDDLTDPSYLGYQALQVSGLADTVADEVVIAIRDGNTVTSGPGDTYVEFQTYDSSDAQAGDLADYIKILFTNDEPVPYQLSYLFTGQDPEIVLGPVAAELRQIDLEFRGTTSKAIVLGFTISITPDIARATLNLLSIQQIPLFQLDIATNGILDTNQLGY